MINNVKMPLEKLLDLGGERYQIARAAMKVIEDLGEIDAVKDIEKPAIYALAKILNQDVTYIVNKPIEATSKKEKE